MRERERKRERINRERRNSKKKTKKNCSAFAVIKRTYNAHGIKGFYPGGSAIALRQITNWASRQGEKKERKDREKREREKKEKRGSRERGRILTKKEKNSKKKQGLRSGQGRRQGSSSTETPRPSSPSPRRSGQASSGACSHAGTTPSVSQ